MFPWEYHNAINKDSLSSQTVTNVQPNSNAKTFTKDWEKLLGEEEGPQMLKNNAEQSGYHWYRDGANINGETGQR